MGSPAKIDYRQLSVERSQMGNADSLRYNVMLHVVEEHYDRAIEALRGFGEAESDFPDLAPRVMGYIEHAVDLVNGIRTKRNFPGFKNLPVSKQQDLSDKFKLHFNELQYVLKQIERIHIDVKLDDVRSTVWVLKALTAAVVAIVAVGFSLDVSKGLILNLIDVVDEGLVSSARFLGKIIGL